MPTAGEEGYEKLIVCPYDKAHEIRKGRMQFHLEKCRRNFPMSQLVDCPYNKGHLVPKQELIYHMEEECESRATWDRYVHEENVDCPVKDLVPVNAATVDDGGENWDNFEATGSVLQHIKAEAENKPIFRMCQVASKATRKAFRQQERLRFSQVAETQRTQPNEKPVSDTASLISDNQPLPKPRRQPNVPVIKQDPTKAVAAINKQFRTLDLNMKTSTGDVAPSETSSMINGPPSEFDVASTSRQMPFSYAAASRAAGNPPCSSGPGTSSTSQMNVLTSQRASTSRPNYASASSNRPQSAMSNASIGSSASSMLSALTHQQIDSSRPPTASSYATASYGGPANRPTSALSSSSKGSSIVSTNMHRPPNSLTCRPTTAMNLVASFKRAPTVEEEGFCQIPIPGLGRGRRRPVQ